MKVKEVEMNEDDVVIVKLTDGSNITLNYRKNCKEQIEINAYTTNKEGYIRENPVIHLINSNTLGLEMRRKKMNSYMEETK